MKNYLLFALLFFLSYLVPKKKNLVLFGAGDAKQFQGNPKYLLLYLLKTNQTELEYYWISKSRSQMEELKQAQIPVLYRYSIKGFFKILRAKYLFIEKSSFDIYYTRSIFGRFNFIQTCHGSPQKKFGTDTHGQNSSLLLSSNQNSWLYRFLKSIRFFSRQKYHLIFAPSKTIETIYKRTFENDNTVIIGYPRNDVFFHHELLISEYQQKFHLDKYAKIVLYAPTFRDNQKTLQPLSDDLTVYNQMLREKNILLIVKKHPWQTNLKISKDLSNVLDLSEEVDDIHELLPFTDILITDYSGIFFDFLLCQKSVIFYPYDLQEYLQSCRGLYYDYYEELQGPFAHSETELFQLILEEDVWKKDEEYQHKFQQVLHKYNQFIDGDSCLRVFQMLYPNLIFKNLK